MGHQLRILSFLLMILSLFLPACLEDQDIAGMLISSEPINQRFDQSMVWNNEHSYQKLVSQTDDYTILSAADIHIGESKNLDKFFEIAVKTDAIAVVLPGDLTTGHKEDYVKLERHIPIQDTLRSFLLVGNHDLHFDGWNEFYQRFGSSSYLFTIETPSAKDLIVCLDTGGGTLGDKQLEWLIELLQTLRPNFRRCIIFTHNNLFRFTHAETANLPVEELVVLLELFTKYRVDLVITGHDHKKDEIQFGLTTYIVLPPLKDGLSKAGYFHLRIKSGNILYNFENI